MNTPTRPFLLLTPAEVADPKNVTMLRQSGCDLRVLERAGGPTYTIEEWLSHVAKTDPAP